ncbi:cytochrome P450 CYP4/CYP19/CYP26 subfamily [Talaromyces proteolyticus]|uniref:Cytochrome P450 CYP4/CYP19/CYP26 subfamily n=1 Tax=Talaromyces proteolyticus TaxID=1131652 RepID=A0AAD4KZE5_9EURO|nr:cytochrome P450 CYP4/CYP19/CYP26 subfamily [Talaromyces proteolyticus]KAH8702362.1 cytochrome P450 CYP4/CYP19/CYP26 subfamily [Talaromyces proteolyticus]
MLPFILSALACYILLLRPLYDYYRHFTNARRLNCQKPRTKATRLPWGIDFVRRLAKASNQDRLCEEVSSFFEEEQCNTFQVWLPQRHKHFWTTEPRNVQAILATQFSQFELPPEREGVVKPMFGRGIFSANGTYWEHSRAMMRPQFTRQQIADLELEERHFQEMLLHIRPDKESGWIDSIDLRPLFFRLTIDSATEFFFGQSVGSQIEALSDRPLKETHENYGWRSLADHFDSGTRHLGTRARLGPLYWLHNPSDFRENSHQIRQFADYFVQEALKRTAMDDMLEKEEAGGGEEKDRKYVFLHELIKQTRDPIELRSQLLHMLLAGRDTTAGLLSWVFFLLARHPKVYQRLRATVIETFGQYDSPQDITFSRLKACTYLQYVMQETLRLYPQVPVNGRTATTDTCLPVGGGLNGTAPVYIKKGERVNYSVYGMQRRKDIWGPDADEYIPDRWASHRYGWEYLPFNGGPRICLGQQFALTEAGYVITRLVQMFDELVAVDPKEPVINQSTLTSTAKQVRVRLHKADQVC